MSTADLTFPAIVDELLPTQRSTSPDATAAEVVDVAEIASGKAVVKFNATQAALVALRTKYQDATYDLTTTAGDKAARAARLELKNLRTGLEAKRKDLKKPAVEFGRLIDAEAARITSEIEALEEPIDAQIKADEIRRENERKAKEQAEADRKAKHEASVATIRGYAEKAKGLPVDRIEGGIAKLQAMEFGAEWEEFAVVAGQARNETIAALVELKAQSERDAEAARLREENARLLAQLAAGAPAPPTSPEPVAVAKPPALTPAANVSMGGAGRPGVIYADVAPPTLKLGTIAERLGFTLTADFLTSLGFPATQVGASKLYHDADFPRMCDALIARVQRVKVGETAEA